MILRKDSDNGYTPKREGFRMPAEWERQDAIWLSWPHNTEWWGEEISRMDAIYGQWAKMFCDDQGVRILVPSKEVEQRARQVLESVGVLEQKVKFYPISTGEIFIRDYGPTFVVRDATGEKAMVCWDFNAWGGKYESSLNDAYVPYLMNEYLHLPLFCPGIVMEGGSIDVNGRGCVLTTESVLLNKNRNPELGKSELEKYLCDYLNVEKVLWLNQGLEGDDTDGHIDDIARFVNARTILCAYEEDTTDVNYAALHENYERLVTMRDVGGGLFDVVRMPMAKVVAEEHLHTGNSRKPASYLNFYIGNKMVAVPIFGGEHDERALEIIGRYFPDRRVAGIDCSKMVLDGGTLHCASQQEPACERKF